MSLNFDDTVHAKAKQPCGCPVCNKPPQKEAEKLCAGKELFWFIDKSHHGKEGTGKIPFDKICRESKSVVPIFLEADATDFLVLENGLYCINFKASALQNDTMEPGAPYKKVFVNIQSTKKGLLGVATITHNGQPLEICRQAFLNAGEVIYFQIEHEVNTETKIKDYKISFESMENCNEDCCGRPKEEPKPCGC